MAGPSLGLTHCGLIEVTLTQVLHLVSLTRTSHSSKSLAPLTLKSPSSLGLTHSHITLPDVLTFARLSCTLNLHNSDSDMSWHVPTLDWGVLPASDPSVTLHLLTISCIWHFAEIYFIPNPNPAGSRKDSKA